MNTFVLRLISYGLYVVSSTDGTHPNGQIANTVMQVCADPVLVTICINKKTLTHEFIKKSRVFSVSVLPTETPMKFIGRFGFTSGRETDKFEGIKYRIGVTGAPILLEHSLGFLEANVIKQLEVHTHTLFVGELVDADILEEGEQMTYAFYHSIKGGTSPKTAPTYTTQPQKSEVNGMNKYKCKVCGYVYDPAKGDPDGDIPPGTSFEDLPDDWTCPVCGVGKDQFIKL